MKDLERYKKIMIEKITGHSYCNLDKAYVIGSVGLEALKLAKEIVNKKYANIRDLEKDLEKLKDIIDFYIYWD